MLKPPSSSQSQSQQGNLPALTSYPKIPYAYDEAFDDARFIRSHWTRIFENLNKLGSKGIIDRQLRAQRILRDDGATYDLKNDPLSPAVWSLDIVPYAIDHTEWEGIEAGVAQRAKLFDLILNDLYGEQTLLKQGIIPSEIIFSHPGYLRECHDIAMPLEKKLIMHAVDMVREADGTPVIIGDRTQAPSGFGYALENRTVVSRVMPSLFRNSQVRRLSHFFNSLRTTLTQLASHKTDTPRIVVLTPGAYSSTYFEQAYLANYLGYSLVQGGDLTVRNGKVWMKSLQGLAQVDVILRRVDDIYCDQAELKSDSMLGVPGLLEVARSGNVVLANPLGSGILEAPALMAFLPQISQFLLGEPLLIKNVQSWWCGNPADFEYVQTNLDSLIIKPAYRSFESKSFYGHTLSEDEKVELLEKIRKRPHKFVAQSYIPGSQMPIWNNGKLESRPSLLRLFSVYSDNDYEVMPGGLCRVAECNQEYIVSKLSGTWSKDAWVLSQGPDLSHQSRLDNNSAIEEAEQSNIPSRVIENLFWFGRYAERAEMNLRLLRTVFKQLNGIDPLPAESKSLLLKSISIQTGCLPGFTEENTELFDNPDEELADLVINANRMGSIKSNLLAMLSCAEQVKEMLSADTRIILNELRDHIADVDQAYSDGLPEVPEESLDSLVTSLLALSGLNHESMLRGLDWTFQEIGRRTERALQTTTLLKSTLTSTLPTLQQQQILESVLLSVEALISFRRRYRTRARVAFGLDLLMIDPTNPRSLIYQVERLREYLQVLPSTQGFTAGGLSDESKMIIRAKSQIQLASLNELAQVDEVENKRVKLEALVVEVAALLEEFTSAISDKYFDHTAGPQQLIKPKWKLDV
ncbi:circularly permuted type 2 ATP-grasp protein [Vibrio sp. RC27]